MTTMSPTAFNFTLLSPTSSVRFGPRLGTVSLRRTDQDTTIQLQTPTLLATTSRGVVPHLSRDHYARSSALKWTHIPFETFLEHPVPVPTLQPGPYPLHTFLGFPAKSHILSMSARDPNDAREVPPNGKAYVSTQTLRGVRKATPDDWRKYSLACKPDIVVALSDTPFTDPPFSQKRLTKSIERSAAWILNLLRSPGPEESLPFSIFVHLAGNTNVAARRAFASSLMEPLYGPEADAAKPYSCLDEAISGYTFDLLPLSPTLPSASVEDQAPRTPHATAALLRASLDPLPIDKPRLVHSTQTPHEILRLISSVGIDLFDSHWAQRAADIGIALDFQFPAPPPHEEAPKRNLGHNLYDLKYADDFSPMSDAFRGALSPASPESKPTCPCAACSPIQPSSRLYHGIDTPDVSGEVTPSGGTSYLAPFTRAYVHHLLHTHEMSAHTLLAMHNLAVLEAFFASIRDVLGADGESQRWAEEVERFGRTYDESVAVFREANACWGEVELARGKGRLAREKKTKEEEGT